MITCEKCRTKFMADYQQGYPGHCDPPASLIAYAILAVLGAALSAGVGLFFLRMIMFALAIACIGGTLVALMSIPEARKVCERSGGGICPSCGHRTRSDGIPDRRSPFARRPGMARGQRVGFRPAVGAAGQGAWSDPATKIVP